MPDTDVSVRNTPTLAKLSLENRTPICHAVSVDAAGSLIALLPSSLRFPRARAFVEVGSTPHHPSGAKLVRVLLVEGSKKDGKKNGKNAARVRDGLQAAGPEVFIEQVSDAESLVRALDRGLWDVVVADYATPDLEGAATLTLVRERDRNLPVIFVSDVGGEDVAVEAMRIGAQDYIGTANLGRLLPAVEREVRDAAERRARTRADQRLAYLAYHDPLTDLPNRTLLNDRLAQASARAQRDDSPLALLVMDLDGFKAINDAHGHHVGDRVLQQTASRLRAFLREVDTVARLGGDEFAILLPSTDGPGAELTARKILVELARPLMLEGRPLTIRASVGIALYPRDSLSADTLMQKADASMYAAKQDGSGYARYAVERDRQSDQRLSSVADLRRGLAEREFVLEYQPIVDLRTGSLQAVEALVRWNHPERGRLLPADFIELAEQAGLADALTARVLDLALAERPHAAHEPAAPVTVNLSARNLQDRLFPEHVADVLRRHGVAPLLLVLEVTEDIILSDPVGVTARLARLHDLGVRLSVDDFGTSYASLTYLRRLPVDTLKIDRSFVASMGEGGKAEGELGGKDEVMVRSTIDLAHNLGLIVVAEGVETERAYDRLASLGCDAAQGMIIAAPQPAGDLRLWLAARDATKQR